MGNDLQKRRNDILKTIQSIIYEEVSKPPDLVIEEKSHLFQELHFTSLDFIILLVALEEKYNIMLSDSDISMQNLITVSQIINGVIKQLDL